MTKNASVASANITDCCTTTNISNIHLMLMSQEKKINKEQQ